MASQAISVETLPSYNPANGEIAERIRKTDPEDLDAIVHNAGFAGVEWQRTPVVDRCALLSRLKQTILAKRNELADTIVRESGKPRVEALFADIFVSLDTAAYYAKNLPRFLHSERVPHHSSA